MQNEREAPITKLKNNKYRKDKRSRDNLTTGHKKACKKKWIQCLDDFYVHFIEK